MGFLLHAIAVRPRGLLRVNTCLFPFGCLLQAFESGVWCSYAMCQVRQSSAHFFGYPKADVVVLIQLTQLRFHLSQPIRHVHFAVHRRCDGQVLLSLLLLPSAAMRLAETEVAVGDEWPHAEFRRQSYGGAVVRFRRHHVGAGMMGGDLAEEAKSPRLIAARTTLTGDRHSAVGPEAGVGDLVREQVRLADVRAGLDEYHPSGFF